MIVSILTRKTRLTERALWEGSLTTVLARIQEVLAGQPGFVAVEYLWGVDEPGRIGQMTTWQTQDDCKHYIRGGAAATVATIEEAAVPTAPYPDGAWVRQNFSQAEV